MDLNAAHPTTPWYINDEATVGASSSYSPSSTSSTADNTPPPPETLPEFLRPLWSHLFSSPFLEYDSIRFISTSIVDAATDRTLKDADLDLSVSSWTDWVVVASLRHGRERGIAGASDAVKSALVNALRTARELDGHTPASGKKAKAPRVRVEGLDVAEPQWCLIDGGRVVVHVMTEAARANWEVEGVAISNIAARGVAEEQY